MKTKSRKSAEVRGWAANLASDFICSHFGKLHLFGQVFVFSEQMESLDLGSVCGGKCAIAVHSVSSVGLTNAAFSEFCGLICAVEFRANLGPFPPSRSSSTFQPMFFRFSTANENLHRDFKSFHFWKTFVSAEQLICFESFAFQINSFKELRGEDQITHICEISWL